MSKREGKMERGKEKGKKCWVPACFEYMAFGTPFPDQIHNIQQVQLELS